METQQTSDKRQSKKIQGTALREEGMGVQAYMIIGAILAVIIFVGVSFYGANPPSSPNVPGGDKQVTTPTQTPAR